MEQNKRIQYTTISIPTTVYDRIANLRQREDRSLWKVIERTVTSFENREDHYSDYCNQAAYIITKTLKNKGVDYNTDAIYTEVMDYLEDKE